MVCTGKSQTVLTSLVLILCLILLTVNVSAQEAARVKVVQLSPNAEPLNVFIDGEREAESLEFGSSTRYIELEPGTHRVRIADSGNDTVLTRSFNFRQGRSYTFATRNFASFMESTITTAQRSRVPNGNAQIRMAHLSPDLLEVDVNLENGNSFSIDGLSYQEVGSYARVSPGNYTVNVRNSRNNRQIFRDTVTLRAGRSYTGFIAGASNGAQNQRFRVVRVLETSVETDTGNDATDGETEEEIIYRCIVVSERPRRLDCRVFR